VYKLGWFPVKQRAEGRSMKRFLVVLIVLLPSIAFAGDRVVLENVEDFPLEIEIFKVDLP
jgi:hypothetical protein